MTNPITIGAIFLGPLAVILILFLAARGAAAARRRRRGTRILPAQRRAGRDLPVGRGRVLGAVPDRIPATLHGRLFLPPETAAGQARRPGRRLHAGELSLFPVRLDARREPLEHDPPPRVLDHDLRLRADHDRQFRDLLSPRLFHGAGRQAPGRAAPDVAAGRSLLGQRNPARVRVSGAVRHRRRHQQRR